MHLTSQAFNDYKERDGKTFNDQIMNMITSLREKKESIKDIYELCQTIKAEMETRKAILQRKQDSKNQEVYDCVYINRK